MESVWKPIPKFNMYGSQSSKLSLVGIKMDVRMVKRKELASVKSFYLPFNDG